MELNKQHNPRPAEKLKTLQKNHNTTFDVHSMKLHKTVQSKKRVAFFKICQEKKF